MLYLAIGVRFNTQSFAGGATNLRSCFILVRLKKCVSHFRKGADFGVFSAFTIELSSKCRKKSANISRHEIVDLIGKSIADSSTLSFLLCKSSLNKVIENEENMSSGT